MIVGQPNRKGSVARMIRELDLGRWVTFTGRISSAELVRQYATASVAVVPSLYEGFGFPAGEAMACGTPVVCTTAGGLPELVGDTGIVVAPANTGALYRALSFCLNHPDRIAGMGRAGLVRIRRHFTWEAAAQKTVSVYMAAIRDHRPPA